MRHVEPGDVLCVGDRPSVMIATVNDSRETRHMTRISPTGEITSRFVPLYETVILLELR